ncbi:hypothetical protein CEXT_665021 [Caerostris extrusa]|uniref:Uncharacterized protein n=1 Tax=Caerostris extrusa TaxID=172846 RepID=A0AAV4RIH3_CAEEX|nr:hypothetical protein CEXT_665021 [Caerostris extrusa]
MEEKYLSQIWNAHLVSEGQVGEGGQILGPLHSHEKQPCRSFVDGLLPGGRAAEDGPHLLGTHCPVTYCGAARADHLDPLPLLQHLLAGHLGHVAVQSYNR